MKKNNEALNKILSEKIKFIETQETSIFECLNNDILSTFFLLNIEYLLFEKKGITFSFNNNFYLSIIPKIIDNFSNIMQKNLVNFDFDELLLKGFYNQPKEKFKYWSFSIFSILV